MILSDITIRERVFLSAAADDGRKLVIRPFSERVVAHGMSYGLSAAGYDIRIKDAAVLHPGDFRLATTVEYLVIPADVMVKLADKSSWARRGLAVQNTIFEPGWCGYPTLELSHHGNSGDISIPAGAPIGQLIFELLDRPSSAPYSGKYQNQPQRPVAALDESSADVLVRLLREAEKK